MIHQSTVLVSLMLVLLITNEVPAVTLNDGVDKKPCVPLGVRTDTNILLPDVTAVVLTVATPAIKVAVPMLAFVPVVNFILEAKTEPNKVKSPVPINLAICVEPVPSYQVVFAYAVPPPENVAALPLVTSLLATIKTLPPGELPDDGEFVISIVSE